MACGAVEHAISLGVNRIVVGADWVAGTQPARSRADLRMRRSGSSRQADI